MRRMQRLLFFFPGCVECPASVGGNIFCIKRLTSLSLCFGEASLEFGFAGLLSGSACACVRHCPMSSMKNSMESFVFPTEEQIPVLKHH